MRVGFNARILAHAHMRGLARYTTELLRSLNEHADIELVLFSKEPVRASYVAGLRAEVIVREAPRESVWMDWVLPRLIRAHGIDVFHAPADRGLPLVTPCPMVVTVHSSYERAHWRTLFPGWKDKAWYWKYELANYWRADAVVTVSDTTARELAALGVVPATRIRRTYLAPAPEFSPHSSPGDAEVRRTYGLPGRYLLYVGGYERHKNVDTLVSAFDGAALPGLDLVVVASQHRDHRELVVRWRALKCFSRLHLLEAATEDLPALYRGALCFVNPSRWESFSFQLLEAMASGTPVISSNRAAMPEIAGGAALLFDPDDVQGLRHLLERTVGDSRVLDDLRGRGRRRAGQFSWTQTAAETVAVYRSLVGGEARKDRGRAAAPFESV